MLVSVRCAGPKRKDSHMDDSQTRPKSADPKRVNEGLGRDDEGVGSVRPEDAIAIDPGDEGVGSVRPEDAVPIDPDDAGIGNVRPEDAIPIDPDDEGIGSVRPDPAS